MIRVTLTNEMLERITSINEYRLKVGMITLPPALKSRFRKNSTKKRAYSSNKIEGNPLTEEQASEVIESDPHRHFLQPEQEIRNYVLAIDYLEKQVKAKAQFDLDLILQVQALVEKGASKEKIGIRKPMPPGILFAVYDSESGKPEYIPPDANEIRDLLEELILYVRTTDDHPLLVAAVVHYQMVTIHPFEDGNGRTARLLSGFILDRYGYGFGGVGSLEEYFAYDLGEYYRSLQMDLPALYYSGRCDPPHPEIWFHYFLRMVELYAKKVYELCSSADKDELSAGLSFLKPKEKELLSFLIKKKLYEFSPISISLMTGITNRTVINRCAKLVQGGFLEPQIANERIMTYRLSDLTKTNERKLLRIMKG